MSTEQYDHPIASEKGHGNTNLEALKWSVERMKGRIGQGAGGDPKEYPSYLWMRNIQRLSEQLSVLEKVVAELQSTLEPVLVPAPPTAGEKVANPPDEEPIGSPLFRKLDEVLRVKVEHLVSIREHVQELTRRCTFQ